MLEFFANGKLLLSGEYAVLDGAMAIGLPTKLGQYLQVLEEENEKTQVIWNAYLSDGTLWFSALLDENLNCKETNNENLGFNIQRILKATKSLNAQVFKNKKIQFTTRLDFPKDWGLGSSSTLISLLAKYASINAFELLALTFGGSGYDISCALFPKVQTYQLTKTDRKVNFIQLPKEITDHIYFVYLNQKQNSREGINKYRSYKKDKDFIKAITDLSLQIKDCKDLTEFEDILYVHEFMVSEYLEMSRIQDILFSDYKKGIIKSLGAWGGDFILVTNRNQDLSYFKQKGYNTILTYKDLIVD